jgi:hypothetical protein
MRNRIKERGSLAARHDFDSLPSSPEIGVQPAQRHELVVLADMANRLVPGVQITEPTLERYFAVDPQSIVTFSRGGRLHGAVAFLYLNSRGHDALILDDMSLTHPDMKLLAGRHEEVSAIYVWAIAGYGRAMLGLGNVSRHLSQLRYVSADLYAQPSSEDGRNLMVALGFEPTSSYQNELWRYERPWNRLPIHMRAPSLSGGSSLDVRQ